MYLKWDDDICWCADSADKCLNTECFRHMENKSDETRIFTYAHLMGTEYCPMSEEGEE